LLLRWLASPIDPQLVTRLRDMLPPITSQPVADLSRLSTDEINQLDVILSKACSVEPFNPLPPDEPIRDPSAHEIEAVRLARMLDEVEARGGPMTSSDINELRNGILLMITPMMTGAKLWEPYIGALSAPDAEKTTTDRRNDNGTYSNNRPSNIVPLRSSADSPWAGLAAANAHCGYQQPDVFDKFGRRIDPVTGIPTSQRKN
jgi:hypothetical protein